MIRSPLRPFGSPSDALSANRPVLYGLALCQPLLIAGIKLPSGEAAAEAPFLLFGGSIVVAAALAGAAAGLAATALAGALSSFVFMQPMGAFAASATEAGHLALFVAEGVLVSMVTGALRTRALRKDSHIRSFVGWPGSARGVGAQHTRGDSSAATGVRRLRRITLVSCGDWGAGDRADRSVLARMRRIPLGQYPAVTLVRLLPKSVEPKVLSATESDLRSVLEAMAEALPEARVSAELRSAVEGDDLTVVAEQRPELIVLSGPDDWRRSDHCRRVVDKTISRGVPVLILSRRAAEPYQRLLIALESPERRSSRGIELALELAPSAVAVHVLHVVDRALERRMAQAGAPYRAILRVRREFRATTRRSLMSWLSTTPEARVWLDSGDATGAIREAARRTGSDLITVCVEDRWLREWPWLGSVVSNILRDAAGDVLIIRTR